MRQNTIRHISTGIVTALILWNLGQAKADTVVFKSGRSIEGSILERSEKHIKLQVGGITVSYAPDEIVTINGREFTAFVQQPTPSPSASEFSVTLNEEQTRQVEEILELSGIKRQIEGMAEWITPSLEPYRTQHPKLHELMHRIMKESYTPDTLNRMVFNTLSAHFDQTRFTSILEWYHSPLAQQITRLEVEASTPEGAQDMQQFAAGLESSPVPDARRELIEEFDAAVGTTDVLVDTMTAVSLHMAKAVYAQVSKDPPVAAEDWEEKAKTEIRKQTRSTLETYAMVSYMYTYRSLSDEDFRQYIRFVHSENGRWLNQIINQGLVKAMGQLGNDFGTRLGEALKNLSASPSIPNFTKSQGGKPLV